ncbi:MAG: cellulose biosynthesis cyclic di-GMP-binding regulatory protein BcsB, partial [Deltaproteobacteria bacterium]|nr:cellulose biosynthesis cyclic di-GMP-binding regulatory protein BcsB [Deltaproteobacteria bacterium]
RHVVVVGTATSLQALAGSPWSLNADAFARDGSGWLVEAPSPFNPGRRMLVVAGRDDEALRLAAEHLKTPASLKNLKGPVVAFDKPPAFEVTPETRAEAAFLVRLQDMKLSDLMARGKFYHAITFTLPNPFVGKIKDGAFIRLSMSHSELLLPQSSSLLVKVNGEPVKSIRLTRDTAPRNTWDVRIPLQYLGSRWLTFEMEVFMDIGDPDCYYNHPEMAWLTLHNDTFLYLPVDTAQGETLANYPYIFLAWNRFDDLAVALVDPLTDGSLTGGFNILAYLAQSLRGPVYAGALFARLSALPEGNRKSNLVLVGPIGSLLGDATWSQVIPKELTARSGGRVDLLNAAGILALAKNPLEPTHRVLAVTGRSDKEIALAAPYLHQTGSVEWVRGVLAVVLGDKELRVLLPPGQADAVAQFDPTKVRFEEKDGKMVPVLEVPKPVGPPSRNNVAFLVFGLLAPILVLLVVLRLRALAREGREKA